MSEYVFRSDGSKCRTIHIYGCTVTIIPDTDTPDSCAERLASDIRDLDELYGLIRKAYIAGWYESGDPGFSAEYCADAYLARIPPR